MLDHVTIKNFRCLREVSVPLKPLTVLIGENDTGKSTFLEAVSLRGRHDIRLRPLDHWDEVLENRVRVDFECGRNFAGASVVPVTDDLLPLSASAPPHLQFERLENALHYRLEVPGGAGGDPTYQRVSRLSVAPDRILFSGEQIVPPETEEEQQAAVAWFLTGNPIKSDGSNVPGVMDQMLRSHRRQFDRMEQRCRELVPGFDSFSLDLPKSGTVQLAAVLEGGRKVSSDRMSAGVRALIFYLTLAYRPDAPDVVLIEEPENGLHPRRLGEVMGLLRLLTEPKADGRRTQVILTTHSPFLLDHVRPDEDQILIFQRQPDGSRTATPADWDRARGFLKHFSPGEIWFNRGEASLVPAPELDESDDRFDALGRPVTPAADGTSPSAGADAAGTGRRPRRRMNERSLKLLIVGDGPRDGFSLPPLVRTALGHEITHRFQDWHYVLFEDGGRVPERGPGPAAGRESRAAKAAVPVGNGLGRRVRRTSRGRRPRHRGPPRPPAGDDRVADGRPGRAGVLRRTDRAGRGESARRGVAA